MSGITVIFIATAGIVTALAVALSASLLAGWLWLAQGMPDPRALVDMPLAVCPDGTAGISVRDMRLPDHVRFAYLAAEAIDPAAERWPPTLRALASALLLQSSPISLAAQVSRGQIAEMSRGERALIWQFRWAVQADRTAMALTSDDMLRVLMDHA